MVVWAIGGPLSKDLRAKGNVELRCGRYYMSMLRGGGLLGEI